MSVHLSFFGCQFFPKNLTDFEFRREGGGGGGGGVHLSNYFLSFTHLNITKFQDLSNHSYD